MATSLLEGDAIAIEFQDGRLVLLRGATTLRFEAACEHIGATRVEVPVDLTD